VHRPETPAGDVLQAVNKLSARTPPNARLNVLRFLCGFKGIFRLRCTLRINPGLLLLLTFDQTEKQGQGLEERKDAAHATTHSPSRSQPCHLQPPTCKTLGVNVAESLLPFHFHEGG